ncbi:hypothetical protein CTAYLR_009990 [Chrysophaeum taylorii]|uniref:Uncharacterized protein n=1 Tax=Chrysophaeum taylorii TaxID=2483200 RepID=A0AAD7UJG4_9STRA|nr:hypothetical protein CTAYLR_009990 [Chrysophaeum taylorii]
MMGEWVEGEVRAAGAEGTPKVSEGTSGTSASRGLDTAAGRTNPPLSGAVTPEADHGSLDEEDAPAKLESGRWSMAEHKRFVEGLEKFGRRKWIRIAQHVGTRTVIQVRSHAQKYFKKLRKDEDDLRPPVPFCHAPYALPPRRGEDEQQRGLALLTAAADILDKDRAMPAADDDATVRVDRDETDDDVHHHHHPREEDEEAGGNSRRRRTFDSIDDAATSSAAAAACAGFDRRQRIRHHGPCEVVF